MFVLGKKGIIVLYNHHVLRKVGPVYSGPAADSVGYRG